jgi:hypothetical protein
MSHRRRVTLISGSIPGNKIVWHGDHFRPLPDGPCDLVDLAIQARRDSQGKLRLFLEAVQAMADWDAELRHALRELLARQPRDAHQKSGRLTVQGGRCTSAKPLRGGIGAGLPGRPLIS